MLNIASFLALAALATAAPATTAAYAAPKEGRALPFNKIVAFGDNFSDDGSGAYAHCTQAGTPDAPQCKNKIYGNGTWTNGPVAITYLSQSLGIPISKNYAYGWSYGAGNGYKMAASINNTFSQIGAGSPAPDAFSQVDSYVSSLNGADISNVMHFLWIGGNDITFPRFQYPSNAQWGNDMADMMEALVSQLVKAGAQHVVVPSLYNKHIAPFHIFMASQPQQRTDMGTAIRQANTIIRKRLVSKFGKKVIMYDAYKRMMDIWTNHSQYGIDKVGTNFCDGNEGAHPGNFALCLGSAAGGARFYWINYTDPTTVVHKLIAQDMYNYIMSLF